MRFEEAFGDCNQEQMEALNHLLQVKKYTDFVGWIDRVLNRFHEGEGERDHLWVLGKTLNALGKILVRASGGEPE